MPFKFIALQSHSSSVRVQITDTYQTLLVSTGIFHDEFMDRVSFGYKAGVLELLSPGRQLVLYENGLKPLLRFFHRKKEVPFLGLQAWGISPSDLNNLPSHEIDMYKKKHVKNNVKLFGESEFKNAQKGLQAISKQTIDMKDPCVIPTILSMIAAFSVMETLVHRAQKGKLDDTVKVLCGVFHRFQFMTLLQPSFLYTKATGFLNTMNIPYEPAGKPIQTATDVVAWMQQNPELFPRS